jgi:hypothetical protein
VLFYVVLTQLSVIFLHRFFVFLALCVQSFRFKVADSANQASLFLRVVFDDFAKLVDCFRDLLAYAFLEHVYLILIVFC